MTTADRCLAQARRVLARLVATDNDSAGPFDMKQPNACDVTMVRRRMTEGTDLRKIEDTLDHNENLDPNPRQERRVTNATAGTFDTA